MSEHLFITTCNICGKRFEASGLNVPIIGEQITERVSKFVSALAAHLQKKHSEQMGTCVMAMQHMFGIECLKNFTMEDQSLIAAMDNVRHHLHMATRKFILPDAVLQDAVARLELSEPDASKVYDAMREMRDVLTEAEQPQSSAIVTPNGTALTQ